MDKRILLIDFDPVAAELTGALLATRGIPFTLARNQAELDRALAAGIPALVVIDPARPDENEGMRLCATVAERLAPAGRIPIILASRSLRGARWKALARDSGAELFLERPKDDRLLLAAAERALGQSAAAPVPPQTAQSAAPPPSRTTTPRVPGHTTAAVSTRTPPPPENELENMVDQMFAQWFADGEGPAASGPVSSPASSRAPATTPAASRTAGAAVAVLEPPCVDAPEIDRAPTGNVRPGRSPAVADTASSVPAPPAQARPAPAVPRPAGSTAPTGPVDAVAPPPPAAMPRLFATTQVATAAPLSPAAGRTAEAAPAGFRRSPMRPAAIAAAVALIGTGVAFVVMRSAGGPEGAAPETAVTDPRGTPLPAARQSAERHQTASIPEAIPGDGTTRQMTNSADRSAAAVPSRSTREGLLSPLESRRAESPVGDRAAVQPAPPKAPPVAPLAAAQATPSSSIAPPAAVTTVPEATAPREAPIPQPEPEFIPDVAPDGTLPAAEAASAAPARYVGPELIASSRATPAFPPGARQMRMSGQVKLQVKVRADGSVGAVSVLSEPKPVVGFGKAAETAVRQWRYRPATLGSRAVESGIVVVVNFAGD